MTTEELQTGIGTKEATSLKPLNVVIKAVEVKEVGEKKSKKIEFSCLHPDSNDLIKISQLKWENKGKLEVSGIWYNTTMEEVNGIEVKKIKKGSALATFLQTNNAENIEAMVGKSIPTVLDEKGYLAFKGY